MQQQQQPEGLFSRKQAGESFTMIHWICTALSVTFTPFIRTAFGSEALGVPAVFAAIILLVVSAAAQDPVMYGWLVLWLMFVVIRRYQGWQLRRKGVVMHSRASYPWLGMKIPLVRKELTAVLMETVMCFIGGAFLCYLSTTAGGFLMIAGFALALKTGIEKDLDRKRIQAMTDASLVQRSYADRFSNPQ